MMTRERCVVLSVQDGRVTREQSPSMDIDVQEEEAEGNGAIEELFHCLLRRPYELCTLSILFVLVLPFSNNSPGLNSSDNVCFLHTCMYRGTFSVHL